MKILMLIITTFALSFAATSSFASGNYNNPPAKDAMKEKMEMKMKEKIMNASPEVQAKIEKLQNSGMDPKKIKMKVKALLAQ